MKLPYCALLMVSLIAVPSSESASATTPAGFDTACTPKPNTNGQVYVIGYGSLLNTTSKSNTYPDTGISIPVNVSGYARKWNCKGDIVGHSTTYLGVDAESEGVFNGAIFKLPNVESLLGFDKRELFYCRQEVKRENIKFLVSRNFSAEINADFPDDDAQFWIYVVKPEYNEAPSAQYPIVQSYVDVYLGGCIDLEVKYNLTNFRDQCMTTTVGWEHPWINDRVLPRRPFVNTPRAIQIDTLIHKHFPEHFKLAEGERLRYNFNHATSQWHGVQLISFLSTVAAIAIPTNFYL